MGRPILRVFSIASFLVACQPSLSAREMAGDGEQEAGRSETVADASAPQLREDGGRADVGQGTNERPDASTDAGGEADPHPAFSFQPSNLELAAADLDRAPAAALDCGQVRLDSSERVAFENWCGETPTTFTQKQTGGPDLLVVPLASLSVAQGTELVVSGERPVVFLVKGNVAIAGLIDASAHGPTAGAGGDLDCGESAGGDADGREGSNGGGGGGGGFGTAGGDGAIEDRITSATAGSAGTPRGDPELVPLLGGCHGGYGGGCAGRRGAGGGALQISASGSLIVSGAIRVDGGEGGRGCYISAGGTGGGSGGALLLEAKQVRVEQGVLSAAGGAGGPGEKSGEPGAGASSASEAGGDGAGDPTGAGAGGGGYGRIHLRTP